MVDDYQWIATGLAISVVDDYHELVIINYQWICYLWLMIIIGLVEGKILTGNHPDFPMKIMGCSFF